MSATPLLLNVFIFQRINGIFFFDLMHCIDHGCKEVAVQSDYLCTATNKGYLTSFKKTTNPNVSPIGKRFGFECFGINYAI